MFRINTKGSVEGRFSDGSPGVRGTVLGSTWLNALQDEIASVIESKGLTHDDIMNKVSKADGALDQNIPDQLLKAIQKIATFGPNPMVFDLPNNTKFDLTGFKLDSKLIRAVSFFSYGIRYSNSTKDISYAMQHYAAFNPRTNGWDLLTSSNQNVRAEQNVYTLSVTSDGQLRCETNAMPGDGYKGTLTISQMHYVKA